MLSPSLITSLVFAATIAWDPTGNWVAGRRVSIPQVAPDGAGGAFVAWDDQRLNSTRHHDSYFQHLTPAGQPAPGWTVGGMPGCTSVEDESFEWMLPDGAGGLYVFWHQRIQGIGLDEYVQRFGPDGQPHPSWPTYGLGYATLPWDEQSAQACSDDQQGFYVAWEDSRRNDVLYGARDCRVRRIPADGAVALGWPDSGMAVSTTFDGIHTLRRVISDGVGGAFVVWNNYRNLEVLEIRVQRVASTGGIAPGWPADGQLVCPVSSNQFLVDAVSDGNHGLVLAWDDDRERPPGTDLSIPYGDIYAARILPDGTHATGWPLDGLPVCVSPGTQWYARMCPDGTGGALMAWTDTRNRWGELYLQRVLGTGAIAPGWPVNGTLISNQPGEGEHPKLAADGAGGAYIGWINDTYLRAHAQHYLGNGTLAPGWTLSGTALADIPGSNQRVVNLCPDGAGNAIIVWQDSRDNATGGIDGSIRAQKLVNDGLVPTQLAMRTVEASADRVRLSWWGGGANQAAFTVERSDNGSDWNALGTATSLDADQLTYEDTTVEPGQRYAYRLVNATGHAVVAAEWVDVPAAVRFALAGARPNPARASELSVAFSLATRGEGTLELLDLAGRRTAWRDIGMLSAGNHTARFHETSGFGPGIYWLRLSQGANRATARVVIVK